MLLPPCCLCLNAASHDTIHDLAFEDADKDDNREDDHPAHGAYQLPGYAITIDGRECGDGHAERLNTVSIEEGSEQIIDTVDEVDHQDSGDGGAHQRNDHMEQLLHGSGAVHLSRLVDGYGYAVEEVAQNDYGKGDEVAGVKDDQSREGIQHVDTAEEGVQRARLDNRGNHHGNHNQRIGQAQPPTLVSAEAIGCHNADDHVDGDGADGDKQGVINYFCWSCVYPMYKIDEKEFKERCAYKKEILKNIWK